MLKRYRRFLPWAAILLIATLLRLELLSSLGTLWNDEAFSRHFALMPLSKMLALLKYDVHPPLHAVMLHVWMKLFGDGAAAVRSLSAATGMAGLIAFLLLAGKLFGKKEAFLALLLAAASPLMVYYGVDGRMYAAVFLFSCLSALFLWQYLEGDEGAKGRWMYASLALVLTHATGILILAAQAAFLRRDSERRILFKKLFSRFALIIAVFSVWFFPVAAERLVNLSSEWQFQPTGPALPAAQALAYWAWLAAGPKLFFASIVFALLVVAGALRRSERRPYFHVSKESEFLLWWLAFAFGPFLLMRGVTPRYLTAAIPAFFLLLAHGFLNAARGKRPAVLLGSAAVVFLSYLGLYVQLTSRPYNWDKVAEWIETRRTEGDGVVLGWFADRLALGMPAEGFYPFDDALSDDERYVAHAGTLAVTEKDFDRLKPLFADRRRVFFIPNYYVTLKGGGSAQEVLNRWFLANGWRLADKRDLEGRTPGVWLMVRK